MVRFLRFLLVLIALTTQHECHANDTSLSQDLKGPIRPLKTILIPVESCADSTASIEASEHLPQPNPAFFNAWEFFGLSKSQLKEKIEVMNKSMGPGRAELDLGPDAAFVHDGDGFNGKSYEFKYEQGKIVRVRGRVHTCEGSSTGPWFDDRESALRGAIREYGNLIRLSHSFFEQDLKDYHNELSNSESLDQLIARDCRRIRDYYIKRASLLKVDHLDSSMDESFAREYDRCYRRAEMRLGEFEPA